ncbi:MAG: sigma-70 family RNA polymerase sigma factor [Flammeovirgaceae bacterium]|nr:sigma-70 family RNA polymerase sigma factor [Flammeovirgaceae bacterium]
MMTTATKISDCELVNQYSNGNERAFEELVRRYKNKIYTAIYLIVKDQNTAEDLLQETFVKAIKTIKSGKYNEEGKFLPWISRIAHNIAIDYFRRQKRYPMVELESTESENHSLDFAVDSFETLQVKKETYARLRTLIMQLPKTQREVLVMRHYMQMSFQDIAEITQVSINTALGRMRYALINLRKLMNKSPIEYAEQLEGTLNP